MGPARLVLTVMVVSLMVCARSAWSQTSPPPEGWVVLPVDEYRALRERANPAPPVPPAPPVEATLTRADYDLRVDGDTVAGKATLTIDVMRDGWVRVQIPQGLMVREATLDGQPVSLVEGPPRHVLLSRVGRSVLTLDVVIPMTTSAGAESITIPPSPAPISRARLALPRAGVDLSLSGGFLADRTEGTTESRWTVYGRPQQALGLTWKRKVDDRRADLPLRARARITQLVGLGEETCLVSATVRVEVLQGLARDIVLAIPSGLAVNQVDGATVADWDVTGSQLHVKLLEPAAVEASFVVQADIRTAREGSIAIPIVRMPSAERETGGIAVDVVGAGEISGRQALGLEPADPSELGETIASRESPSMIGFRHRPLTGADARSLSVSVVRYTPQAVSIANIEEARYRALVSEDGSLLVEARYAVRNNQRSFLKATLPAGATLWSAEIAGRPVRPGAADSTAVLLPLEKGRAGQEAPTFVVELVYLQHVDPWKDKGRPRLELPALDLPVSRTGFELRYSPRYRVEAQAGAFRVDVDPGPFAPALRAPVPAPAKDPKSVDERAASGLLALADKFRREAGGRTVIGSLPVHVLFPAVGPAIFLASELTAESQAPAVDLVVRRVGN
jgi:hypothetical protein